MSGRPQAGGRYTGMVQFAGMAHIPAFETDSSDLRVELQCEREIVDCKCLMGIEFCLCQVESAGGKIEGIPMPVEDG